MKASGEQAQARRDAAGAAAAKAKGNPQPRPGGTPVRTEGQDPVPPEERRRIARIRATLARMYPDATTALNWRTPFELLVATILSAQTTDAAVNQVTPALFARCPTPAAMLELTEDELGAMIRTIGLWRNKARNLLAACRILVERHGGQVPRTREELVQLPGVGRKTANVVLSNAFGIPAIAVDTHVFRVARRLGLASGTTPERVEQELMEKIPEAEWSRAHHWLIWHGRRICHARNPRCDLCALRPDCPTGRARLAAGDGDGTGPAEAAATGTPPGAPDQPVASGGRRPAAGGRRAVKPRGGPARDGHGPAAN